MDPGGLSEDAVEVEEARRIRGGRSSLGVMLT